MNEDKQYCFYCKKEVMKGNPHADNALHIDHVYPKSVFPELENFELNHVISCGSCNRRKNNMSPSRWWEKMQEYGDYDECDLDRVCLRMSIIVFEAIRAGYITFDQWPLMSFEYSKFKFKQYVKEVIEEYQPEVRYGTG